MVAWGAFYFKVKSHGEMKLIKPEDLKHIHPPRADTIGARSAPYGPARIEVRNTAGETVTVAFTDITNHCWVTGLEPDTEYTLPKAIRKRPVISPREVRHEPKPAGVSALLRSC